MGWSSPRDWTTGEVVTEAMMDTHVRDNLRYLKGLDGAVTLSDALILPDGAGYYLHIPILTTAQRDALTPTAGMMVYNSTTTQFNKYENGAWRADLGFNSHHGDLSGLTDDDHTIYQKEDLLTTQGDMAYATAASTWARLPKGTAGQQLMMNAGATAPQWGAGVFPQYGVIIWTGTIASIPSGFVICDGNNGTANLLTRFIEGVATAGTNPGTTGGGTSKSLNIGSNTGNITSTTRVVVEVGTETGVITVENTGAETLIGHYPVSNLITDIRPLYYDVAFIQKT